MSHSALVRRGPTGQVAVREEAEGCSSGIHLQADEVRVADEDHEHARLQEHMRQVIKKDARVYVKIESYNDVLGCLEKKNHVTLTGKRGCGKTAMAFQILRDYSEGDHDILIVDDPNDLKHDRDPSRPTVALIDDVFGRDDFPSDSIYKWQCSLENELCPLMGYGSKGKSNLKCIFTSQCKRFDEAVEDMSYLKQTVFDDNFVYDVSLLTESDKKKIIKKHKKNSMVDIDRPIMRELCSVEAPFGFPRSCQRLFLQKFCPDPVGFFKDPTRSNFP